MMVAIRKPFSYIVCMLLILAVGRAAAATPEVERLVLENQTVVLVSEQHHLPFVTFRLLMDAGAWRDPVNKWGLANLTAESLLLGTTSRPLSEINQELDFLGAELSTECSHDYMTVSFRVLKKNLDQGLAIFEDVVFNPAFPAKQVRRKIQELKGAIRSEEEQPLQLAEKNFMQMLFQEMPYGHPVEGTLESLSGIEATDVAAFYKRHYRPNNAVIAIVGDITQKEIQAKILPALKQWAIMENGSEETVENVFAESTKPVRIDRPVAQANIILGHPGIARSNGDYYTVSVMNQIFGGGGFTSMLLREIRVKRGLAYSVESFFDARKFPGSFQIVLQTKNSSANEAVNVALEQMQKMRNDAPADEALDTAKNYLIGSFPMRFDSQSELANYLVQIEYYDLGLDYFEEYPSYIEAVSGKDVLQAARTYLHPDRIVSSIVADMEEADLK